MLGGKRLWDSRNLCVPNKTWSKTVRIFKEGESSYYSNRAYQQGAEIRFLRSIIQARSLNLSSHISDSLPNHQVLTVVEWHLFLLLLRKLLFYQEYHVFKEFYAFSRKLILLEDPQPTRQLSVLKFGVSQVTLSSPSNLSSEMRMCSVSYMSLENI